MSQGIILCNFMKRTFTFLQTNKNQISENCEDFSKTLNGYIDELSRKCGMQTSLDHFKVGTLSLHGCCHNVKITTEARFADSSNDRSDLRKEIGNNGEISKPVQTKKTGVVLPVPESKSPFSDKAKPTKQSNDSNGNERMAFSPDRAGLQEELQMIKESGEFQTAVNYFKKANESLAQVFKDKDEIKTKIKATEVRVICELLGNLTDLTDAVEKCKQYLLQLHELLNVRDSNLTSIMNINVVLYDFVRSFIGKPVVILDWPMIDAEGPKKLHPILENLEDPFTQITDINKKNVQIELSTAAINCSGHIFAKEKVSTDIVKITSNCNKWYSLNDDSGAKIVSIAIDCTDCKTPTESKLSEPSTQSNPRLTSLVCGGKMYILVRCEFQRNVRYFLHVIDMDGKKEHEEELGFLERKIYTDVKIFCINNQKLVILDVTRRVIHICDHKGMEKNTIDAADYLSSVSDSRPPIFTRNGEMICLWEKYGVNKINVDNIVIDQKSSFLEKTGREIKVKKGLAVQALTFNQKSDEITMLCYTVLSEYHLVTYAKDGELKQDIKLSNYNKSNKYFKAGLICSTNGPIALLDDFKLLI